MQPATSISSRHQPSGRHSSGSIIRTACTRRCGTVSATVPSRPRLTRIPSGACATVKPYSVDTRRQTSGASESSQMTSMPPVAAVTAGQVTSTTTSATSRASSRLALEARTEPTRRQAGTLASTASSGSGVAGSSPWCAASSRARRSSAACSVR